MATGKTEIEDMIEQVRIEERKRLCSKAPVSELLLEQLLILFQKSGGVWHQ